MLAPGDEGLGKGLRAVVQSRAESLRALRAVIRHCIGVSALHLGFCALPATVGAAELKQKTVEAFNHYVEITEARMEGELGGANGFLWVERQPEQRRQQLLAQLLQGRILVEHLESRLEGKPISIPNGMVHHWMATVFVPGVNLPQTFALLQDYDHYQDIYKPDIQRSRVLSTDGRFFRVYLRLYRKTIVTVVYNAEFDIRYFPMDATREYSRSFATRIAEVENPGKLEEHEKPIGRDRGFLWRLNTYWHYEERDNGVYIQIEFVALSRSIPAIFAWLVNPYVKSIPREYLNHLLEATRAALAKRKTSRTEGVISSPLE